MLSQSSRLTTDDLVGIAEQKGQAHLLAIAGRSVIEQKVTEVLVDRGDRKVVHRLAANTGALVSATELDEAASGAPSRMSISSKSSAGASTFRCISSASCC